MLSIPVLNVRGRSLAEGYERALVALYREGTRFRTQYDKPGDPPSIDATMNLTIEDPLADPMIHKGFLGGLADLREYVYELEGRKDGWVKAINDPQDTRWEYTYHGRLQNYGQWKERHAGQTAFTGPIQVDQVEYVIAKLSAQPFTRQAQMITWMPNLDLACYDPPCLQSLWYRILTDDAGIQWLNVNVRFRSNDAWGANFMNMFGFAMFNRDVVAAAIEQRSGKPTRLARMNWQADSYHIYGKDIAQAEQRLFTRLDTTAFEDRVYRMDDPAIAEMYHEEETAILRKIAEMSARLD